jgi:hypothetical protein
VAQLVVYNNNSKTQLTKHTKLNHQVGSLQKYQQLIEAANDTHMNIHMFYGTKNRGKSVTEEIGRDSPEGGAGGGCEEGGGMDCQPGGGPSSSSSSSTSLLPILSLSLSLSLSLCVSLSLSLSPSLSLSVNLKRHVSNTASFCALPKASHLATNAPFQSICQIVNT